MRRVGVFEFEKHPFFFYYMTQIANTDRNDVTLLTTKSLFEQIEPLYTEDELREIEVITKDAGESQDAFFHRAESICSNELDFLWVNLIWGTGRTPVNYLDFSPDCAMVGGVTNLNDWAYNPLPRPVYPAAESVARLLRDHAPNRLSEPVFDHLRYLLQPGIIANYDGINIEYPSEFEYARNHTDWVAELYDLMPVVYESAKLPRVENEQEPRVRIGIPGRISTYIRDYHTVLDALEPLFESCGDQLALDLIGQPQGSEDLMRRIDDFRARGYDISYRTEWIPFDDFAYAISRCDVLLGPVRVHRPLKHPLRSDQMTGYKNGTGIIYDAIRYAKPLILPAAFPVDSVIEPFTYTYGSTGELRGFVREAIDDGGDLTTLRHAAIEGAKEFDADAQGTRFDEIVDDVLQRHRG